MSERQKPPLQNSEYLGYNSVYPTAESLNDGYTLDALEVENLRRALDIARAEAKNARIENAENWQNLISDRLTGCYSRWYFERRKKEVLKSMPDPAGKIAIAYFDLNGFKAINDRYGHPVGDQLLTRFGNFLNENFRDDDMAFRIGGDEFAVIFQQSEGEDADAEVEPEDEPLIKRNDRFPESFKDALVRKISKIQSSSIKCPAGEVEVTFSWGVAVFDPEDKDLNGTAARADHEMYDYKNRHPGHVGR